MTERSALMDRRPASAGPALATKTLAPLRSSLRWPAAAAALVAAAAHVPVTAQHLTEVPYVGWLFIGLSATCALGAAALAVRDQAVTWVILAASCLAAVAGYVLSRGPGLPGMNDDVGDWSNHLGLISIASESSVVLLAVTAFATRRGALARWAMSVILIGGAVLTVATYVLGIATT